MVLGLLRACGNCEGFERNVGEGFQEQMVSLVEGSLDDTQVELALNGRISVSSLAHLEEGGNCKQ